MRIGLLPSVDSTSETSLSSAHRSEETMKNYRELLIGAKTKR